MKKHELNFTFNNLENYYKKAIENGYDIITCADFLRMKNLPYKGKILVNRVDIDISVNKAERLLEIFSGLNIRATFFVRLHSDYYNPFSFENYRIIKRIKDCGHELGYHSEIIEQAIIWNEDPVESIKKDISIFNRIFDVKIQGIASHGGRSGLNNLDFWEDHSVRDFDVCYEAYDNSQDFGLFFNSMYISDSSWYYWKCYVNGKLVQGDTRTFGEHLDENPEIIYLLIHPETYYDNHPYE